MVRIFRKTFEYENRWSDVTLAIFMKYPNPFASHVLASDVIDRYIDEHGKLHTTRLFLKKGFVPRWGKSLMGNSEAYIVEESIVDPTNMEMRIVTRNLSHVKLMLVEETQVIRPNGDGARIETHAKFVSNVGWSGIRARIEGFGMSRFKDNVVKSSDGLKYVLCSMRRQRE